MTPPFHGTGCSNHDTAGAACDAAGGAACDAAHAAYDASFSLDDADVAGVSAGAACGVWVESSIRFRFGFVVACFAELLENFDGAAIDMLKKPLFPRVRGKDFNRLSNPPLGWFPVVGRQRCSLQPTSCDVFAANTALDFA